MNFFLLVDFINGAFSIVRDGTVYIFNTTLVEVEGSVVGIISILLKIQFGMVMKIEFNWSKGISVNFNVSNIL